SRTGGRFSRRRCRAAPHSRGSVGCREVSRLTPVFDHVSDPVLIAKASASSAHGDHFIDECARVLTRKKPSQDLFRGLAARRVVEIVFSASRGVPFPPDDSADFRLVCPRSDEGLVQKCLLVQGRIRRLLVGVIVPALVGGPFLTAPAGLREDDGPLHLTL